MAIDATRGATHGSLPTQQLPAPQPGGAGQSRPSTNASALSPRGIPGGHAPQLRAPLPRSASPAGSLRSGSAGTALQSTQTRATELARRVGRELAAFVPDRVLRSFSFSSHLLNRPSMGQVLQQTTSQASHLDALSGRLHAARGNPEALQQLSSSVQASFKDARQPWRALRQTPASQLLANREAVKHQLPQLQAAVEKAYHETAQAYPPTHPAWKEAAKARLMSEVSTFHVYARMAAVNVLGLRSMVAGPAGLPR